MDQWLRKQYGAHRTEAMVGLGISLDEFTRMRTNTDADTLHWKTLDYPLIELALIGREPVPQVLSNFLV